MRITINDKNRHEFDNKIVAFVRARLAASHEEIAWLLNKHVTVYAGKIKAWESGNFTPPNYIVDTLIKILRGMGCEVVEERPKRGFHRPHVARNIALGDILTVYRADHDMSCIQLGKQLGISKAGVAQIERHEHGAGPDTMSRIRQVMPWLDKIISGAGDVSQE